MTLMIRVNASTEYEGNIVGMENQFQTVGVLSIDEDAEVWDKVTCTTTKKPCYVVDVHFPHAGVDRPHTFGWRIGEVNAKNKKLADRLVAAVNAQKAAVGSEIRTDIEGKTYVAHDTRVMGKRMNADLKRLGF